MTDKQLKAITKAIRDAGREIARATLIAGLHRYDSDIGVYAFGSHFIKDIAEQVDEFIENES